MAVEIRIRKAPPDLEKIAEQIAKDFHEKTIAGGLEAFMRAYIRIKAENAKYAKENHELRLQVQDLENKKHLLRSEVQDLLQKLDEFRKPIMDLFKRLSK